MMIVKKPGDFCHTMDKIIQEKLITFFSKHKKVYFKKGAKIISPEFPITSGFLLEKGLVRVLSFSKNGHEVTLNLFKPFSLFPMGSIINGSINHYYYEALDDVCIYMAPKNEVLVFLKTNPDVCWDLLARIYYGLDGYFQMVEALIAGNAADKVKTHKDIAKQRFGPNYKFTHTQLASMAGLARETVTRKSRKLI